MVWSWSSDSPARRFVPRGPIPGAAAKTKPHDTKAREYRPNSYQIRRRVPGQRSAGRLSAHSLSRRVRGRSSQNLVQLCGVDGLYDLQPLDYGLHLRPLLGEDPLGRLVRLLDEAADFLVDQLRDFL